MSLSATPTTPGTPTTAAQGRRLHPTSRWHYVACYGFYLVILALCFESFWIWRTAIEVVVGYFYRKNEAFRFIYLTATLLIGLVLFGVVVGAESYLRRVLEQSGSVAQVHGPLRQLFTRFLRLVIPLALTLLVAFALQEWIFRRAGV